MHSDPNDAAIAKTVLDLANNLGLDAVAEGVESDEQMVALRALGCRYFQGFLFGKPSPMPMPALPDNSLDPSVEEASVSTVRLLQSVLPVTYQGSPL